MERTRVHALMPIPDYLDKPARYFNPFERSFVQKLIDRFLIMIVIATFYITQRRMAVILAKEKSVLTFMVIFQFRGITTTPLTVTEN